MSFKCLTLYTLLLLIGIEAIWAEPTKVLQPRPSKALGYEKDELYKLDDEDGDDIIDDFELDDLDLDNASVAELNKILNDLEAMERDESRAARGNRGGNRATRRRNRSGPNKCGLNRRSNRRGMANRGGNKRNRNGKRRRNGAKRVARL